jgi:hypothetical protein
LLIKPVSPQLKGDRIRNPVHGDAGELPIEREHPVIGVW